MAEAMPHALFAEWCAYLEICDFVAAEVSRGKSATSALEQLRVIEEIKAERHGN